MAGICRFFRRQRDILKAQLAHPPLCFLSKYSVTSGLGGGLGGQELGYCSLTINLEEALPCRGAI